MDVQSRGLIILVVSLLRNSLWELVIFIYLAMNVRQLCLLSEKEDWILQQITLYNLPRV